MGRIRHFGVSVNEKPDGMKLTKDNYILVNNKSSFTNDIYSDEWCQKHKEMCLYNFDKNINYFKSLDKSEFNSWLNAFISKNSYFTEITNLNDCDGKSGYYIMVLGEYKQVYIGTTKNIKKRIMSHWSTTKQFDRLVFGSYEDSIISIDSFRALDTTRIFVYYTEKIFENEDELINKIPSKYCLNRTAGGITDNSLKKAIDKRKTRNMDQSSETHETKYTITDLTKIMNCSRYMIMKYYSKEGLPLKKEKNKYVIEKNAFEEWKYKFDKKRIIQWILTLALIIFFIILVIFIFFTIE